MRSILHYKKAIKIICQSVNNMKEKNGNVTEDSGNEFEMIPDRFCVLPQVTQGRCILPCIYIFDSIRTP